MRFTWFGIILAALGVWALLANSMILGIVLLVLAFTVGGLDLFKGTRRGTVR
jgi:hypothetical protein